jgi:hypothetical protein
MSTVDPVQVLREYIAKSKEIKLKEDNLIFGSKAFNLLTPTNWKPKNTEKPYKLGEIWLFLDAKVTKSGQLKDYFEALKNMGQKYKLKLISAPHQGNFKLSKTK